MTIGLLPFGRLSGGGYGVYVQDGTETPLASAIEVVPTLPDVNSSDNFQGRCVFNIADQIVYVWRNTPLWVPLGGMQVSVGSATSPPLNPLPATGAMYYSTTNQILYLYDGTGWQVVGGAFGATVVVRQYTGDNVTTTYATGATGVIPVGFVEVAMDGILQYPITDYIVLGNNVQFLAPPPLNVSILVRTFTSLRLVQNATVNFVSYTGDGATRTFSANAFGIDPAAVFVTENGVEKLPNIDYTILSQDTTIVSLNRVGTVGTAITENPHTFTVGNVVTLAGALETGWDQPFTILTTPTPTSFTIAVPITVPSPATANPILFYQPPSIPDQVSFFTPPTLGVTIGIRTLSNIILGTGSVGGTDAATNIGAGVGIFAQKVGNVFQLKSVASGTNTTVVDNGNGTISINSTGGTASTLDNRSTTNTNTFQVPTTATYVGVLNTTSPVTIDLSLIPIGPSQAGRHLYIGDESGGAATHNITISTHAPTLINNSSNPYVISLNYGFVYLTYDGSNWFIRSVGRGTPTGPAGGSLTGSFPNPGLVNSGVTAGPYTFGAGGITVGVDGRISAAHSGAAGNLAAGTPLVVTPIGHSVVISQTHGLPAQPTSLETYLQCTSAELGYSVGDRIYNLSQDVAISADLTKTYVTFSSRNLSLVSKIDFSTHNLTTTKWLLRVTPILRQ